jgi:hypothetical protein
MNSTANLEAKSIQNDFTPRLGLNITAEDRNSLSTKNPDSRRFLEKKREKSEMSYYNASRILTILQRATGQSPDDFLKWAEQQKPNVIQDKLEDIAKQLPESVGYNFKNSARGLLKSRGIKLPTADNSYDNKQEHPAYKKEEIIRMLSYLQDKRHKLYALLIYESGFRPHHVLLMEIRHIKNDLDNDMIPTAIQLDPEHYKGKKAAGYAFLGRESIKLLKECQDEGKVGKEPTDRIMALHYSSLNEALRRAKRQAKLNEAIQPSHGLRKAFEYALDKAGIDHDLKMRIEGHNNGTRGKAYTTKDADELRPEYLRAYPWIDLTDPTGTKAWTELKKEHKTAQEATSEMQELREKMTEQNQKLNAVLEFLKSTTGADLSKSSATTIQEASKHPALYGELISEKITEIFNKRSHMLADRFETLPDATQKKYEIAFETIQSNDLDEAETFLNQLEEKPTKETEQLRLTLEQQAMKETKERIERLEKWQKEETSQEKRDSWNRSLTWNIQRLRRLKTTPKEEVASQ